MRFTSGNFSDTSGSDPRAQLLAHIKAQALAEGWTVLRDVTTGDNPELIMKGVGLSGKEAIYIGYKMIQSSTADVYNIAQLVATGYQPGGAFETGQPGAKVTTIPAHNRNIAYWLNVNAQRVAMVLKVATPVYVPSYLGKLLPYVTPGQFPYPVVNIGMYDGAVLTRYSDPSTLNPLPANSWSTSGQFWARLPAGNWAIPTYCYPYRDLGAASSGTPSSYRAMNSQYDLLPITPAVLNGSITTGNGNLIGELDGFRFITGFDNSSENTSAVGPDVWHIFQAGTSTRLIDYYALQGA